MSKETELRYVPKPTIQVEEREGRGKVEVVRGTAVKFGELSRNLGFFREKFDRDAFNQANMDDVVALFNHNWDMPLARTISNTLQLNVDDDGLHYEFEAPNTTAGRDLIENLRSGNVQHSSFSFSINEDRWDEDDEHGEVRTVLSVKRLYDVSPVVNAAYPQSVSQIAKRSYDEYVKKHRKTKTEENHLSDIDYLEHEINTLQ